MPEPRRIEEQGQSPFYYRLPQDIVTPSFRVGIGANARLPLNEETGKGAFALDLMVGAALGFGRGSPVALWSEAGYSYVGFSEHLASIGLGPLLRDIGPSMGSHRDDGSTPPGSVAFALMPRFLVGDVTGSFGLGARTSFLAAFWMYGFEVAHQFVVAGPRHVHELHFMFTNVGFFREEG